MDGLLRPPGFVAGGWGMGWLLRAVGDGVSGCINRDRCLSSISLLFSSGFPLGVVSWI